MWGMIRKRAGEGHFRGGGAGGSAVIGLSCCGVPALIFKLLLVYGYVLITSVCISTVFFLYSSGQS